MSKLNFPKKILCQLTNKFFFFILFSACINAFAQRGIYEIKYKFYEKDQNGKEALGQEYNSLIFYYDLNSGDNIMRTRYYDQNDGWVVVEQKLKMSLSTANNKNYWTLAGQDAKFITTVNKDAKYNPDNIVLSKDPSETFYNADYVYDNANNKGIVTSFKVLNKSDVDNNYLSPYKWSWTQPTTNTTNTTKTNNNDLNNATLHLILVTNSNDPKLGNGFAANHRNVKALFKEAANTCNMKLDLVEIDGYTFGKDAVSSAINNINAGSNDVIIFYYSGHGFRFPTQTADWPQLDLRKTSYDDIKTNTLNLGNDIYTTLSHKNAGLLMVIGECCNVTFGAGTPTVPNPAQLPLGANVMNTTAVKNLFSKHGKILIATSKPYESSWYYPDSGGIFYSSFSSSFLTSVGYASNNTNATWEHIFDDAIKYTIEKSDKDQAEGTKIQHPIHYYELK